MIEVSNYSFTGEDFLNKVGINEDKELRLRNPLASDQDRLRRTLVPGIITDIELNERFNESFRIFELGRVYLEGFTHVERPDRREKLHFRSVLSQVRR
jgi:phenylalanyl-tRNA synthetase beta subunit